MEFGIELRLETSHPGLAWVSNSTFLAVAGTEGPSQDGSSLPQGLSLELCWEQGDGCATTCHSPLCACPTGGWAHHGGRRELRSPPDECPGGQKEDHAGEQLVSPPFLVFPRDAEHFHSWNSSQHLLAVQLILGLACVLLMRKCCLIFHLVLFSLALTCFST